MSERVSGPPDRPRVNLGQLDRSDWNGLRDQVVDLLGRGFSVTYTAKALGRPWKVIAELARSEMEERFSKREQIKQSHAFQITWLKKQLVDAIEGKKAAGKDFNRKDCELLLRLLEREARLFGLDSPIQVEHKEVDQFSDEELRAELARHGVSMKLLGPAVEPLPEPDPVPDAEWTPTEEPTGE